MNGKQYYKFPINGNIFINHKLELFDLDMFVYLSMNLYDNGFSNQDILQAIKETNQQLYLMNTTLKHPFKPSNIRVLNPNDSYININGLIFTKTADTNAYRNNDKVYFIKEAEIKSIQSLSRSYVKSLAYNIDESNMKVQSICNQIMQTNGKTYVPKSTRRKLMLSRKNLIDINDDTNEIKIDSTNYIRHPYFKNIFGTKNLKILDIENYSDFKYLENPSLKIVLPFMSQKKYYIIDSEHVYHSDSYTINDQEINWEQDDILKDITPLSMIRKFHPKYSDRFVDFYGQPYRVNIDLDTEETIFTKINVNPVNQIIIRYEDRNMRYDLSKFAYECHYNTLIEEGYTSDFINSKPISQNEFRYCKFNLKLISSKIEDALANHRYLHPGKFSKYGWDFLNEKVYSYYTNKYIVSYLPYVKVVDEEKDERISYPIEKFKWECLHNEILDEGDFVINDQRIKYLTESFELNNETFRITKIPEYYISENDHVFYTTFNTIVPVENDMIKITQKKSMNIYRLK